MPALFVPAAYYTAAVDDFIAETPESILGTLTARSLGVESAQRDAWLGEIAILKTSLAGIDATVFLEFDVPRIGSRIDAVLVAGPAVFVLEFKVGEREFNTHDYNQAWDYALDLKNFHRHARTRRYTTVPGWPLTQLLWTNDEREARSGLRERRVQAVEQSVRDQ